MTPDEIRNAALDEIDDLLSQIEDIAHGRESDLVFLARRKLQKVMRPAPPEPDKAAEGVDEDNGVPVGEQMQADMVKANDALRTEVAMLSDKLWSAEQEIKKMNETGMNLEAIKLAYSSESYHSGTVLDLVAEVERLQSELMLRKKSAEGQIREDEGDRPETIERNPRSWAAWKREAESLQSSNARMRKALEQICASYDAETDCHEWATEALKESWKGG